MALFEIEAGPSLVSAAVTRDAVDEIGLAPGLEADVILKATDVMIERGNRRGGAHDDEGLARYPKQFAL